MKANRKLRRYCEQTLADFKVLPGAAAGGVPHDEARLARGYLALADAHEALSARLAGLEHVAEAARALREHLANVEPIRFKFDPVTLGCPGCDVWNALLDALAAVDAQEPKT